jgi:hypothetical protein
VQLVNQLRAVSMTVKATGVTNTSAQITLPADPAALPAGVWTAQALIFAAGQPGWITNELPFALAPTLTNLPLTVSREPSGTATITLDCEPEVGPDQDCALLLGPQPIVLPAPRSGAMSTVTFAVAGAAPGTYPVRLRVDGVDSLLIDAAQSPPVYDPDQVVVIE